MNNKLQKNTSGKANISTVIISFIIFFLMTTVAFSQVHSSGNATNTQTPSTTLVKEKKEVDAQVGAKSMTAKGYFALFVKLHQQEKTTGRNTPAEKQRQLDQVIDKMEQQFPESFEYHYAKYLNGGLDTSLSPHLFKALELTTNKKALYDDMAAYYELANQPKGKLKYCKLLKEQQVYPKMLLTYANNLFRSTEAGAWIFTNGEWDTYPAWIIQHAESKRKDLTVLNLELLQQPAYFKRVMEPFRLKKGAYDTFMTARSQFFRDLITLNTDKSLYLTLTVDKALIRDLNDILYTTGLAMKLSIKPINNLTILEKCWKTFDLEDLDKNQGNRSLNRMNGNYILPMALLYQHYLEQGDQAGASAMKSRMMMVADQTGRKQELTHWFEKEKKK